MESHDGICPGKIASVQRGRIWVKIRNPDVLNKFPVELSGGMKQRIIMVISTLLDPKLLIADEITSALDDWVSKWPKPPTPRCRNGVNSPYLPACGFPAPGDTLQVAPLEEHNSSVYLYS